jgi:hypothetical protein
MPGELSTRKYSWLVDTIQAGPVSVADPCALVTPETHVWSAALLVQSFPDSSYLVRARPPLMRADSTICAFPDEACAVKTVIVPASVPDVGSSTVLLYTACAR